METEPGGIIMAPGLLCGGSVGTGSVRFIQKHNVFEKKAEARQGGTELPCNVCMACFLFVCCVLQGLFISGKI